MDIPPVMFSNNTVLILTIIVLLAIHVFLCDNKKKSIISFLREIKRIFAN